MSWHFPRIANEQLGRGLDISLYSRGKHGFSAHSDAVLVEACCDSEATHGN